MNFLYVKRKQLLFFPVFLLLLLSACTKIITTDIGGSLLPPSDNITTKDTFITVYAKNAGDSAIYLQISDDHVVGYVNNPIFGETKAVINFQMQPPYFPYSFGINKDSIIAVDSVVLILHYDGIWGDSTMPLSLRVSKMALDQNFVPDSSYSTARFFDIDQELTYNNTPVIVNPKGLGNDSFHAFQDSGVSAIRIRLSDDLGKMFLQQFDDKGAYANDSAFNFYFKGIQLSAQSSGNSLFKIALTNPGTKLALYYKFLNPDSAGVKDTAVRYFTVNSGTCAHSNNITRNRTGSQYASFYNSANTQDSLLFLEANPGNFVNVSIPGLSSLKNVFIHRAELLMNQIPDNSDTYFSPPLLMLTGYDADSMKRIALLSDILDLSGNVSLASFGSFPISTFTDGVITYSYNLNVSRYIQGIVTKHDSNYQKLALYAPFYTEPVYSSPYSLSPFAFSSVVLNNPACGRIRLAGGNVADTTKRMRLHIVYSLLK